MSGDKTGGEVRVRVTGFSKRKVVCIEAGPRVESPLSISVKPKESGINVRTIYNAMIRSSLPFCLPGVATQRLIAMPCSANFCSNSETDLPL